MYIYNCTYVSECACVYAYACVCVRAEGRLNCSFCCSSEGSTTHCKTMHDIHV